MIKKMKKNALLVAIVATLFGLGAKNVASAAQVASVPSTRYEIWYVYGGSRTTYLVMYCFFGCAALQALAYTFISGSDSA